MPKSNSKQKSTPDARIRHQQVEAEQRGEERPENPEGNLRELMWDSNLNCGIAREREN